MTVSSGVGTQIGIAEYRVYADAERAVADRARAELLGLAEQSR